MSISNHRGASPTNQRAETPTESFITSPTSECSVSDDNSISSESDYDYTHTSGHLLIRDFGYESEEAILDYIPSISHPTSDMPYEPEIMYPFDYPVMRLRNDQHIGCDDYYGQCGNTSGIAVGHDLSCQSYAKENHLVTSQDEGKAVIQTDDLAGVLSNGLFSNCGIVTKSCYMDSDLTYVHASRQEHHYLCL